MINYKSHAWHEIWHHHYPETSLNPSFSWNNGLWRKPSSSILLLTFLIPTCFSTDLTNCSSSAELTFSERLIDRTSPFWDSVAAAKPGLLRLEKDWWLQRYFAFQRTSLLSSISSDTLEIQSHFSPLPFPHLKLLFCCLLVHTVL